MITTARMKDLLVLNLRDERMTSTALFIQELLQRREHGGGIEQYRIYNTTTGLPVTSLEQFIAEIDPAHIQMSYPYEGERLQTDRVTGFWVRLGNFEVRWDHMAQSDRRFSSMYDLTHQRYFQLCMVYMNDGDEVLPLKISYVKLIGEM